MSDLQATGNRLERLVQVDPDVVRHAARVSVWARWFVWVSAVGLLAYRPGLWFPHDIGYVFLNAAFAVSNGIVHYRIVTNRPVTWRWMLFLSAMDIAILTGTIIVSGRFDNYVFMGYFPALTIFTVVFTSFRINMVWTTVVAGSHVAVSLLTGSGLDIDAGDERALFARVATMYLIVAAIGLVIQFERSSRRAAMAGERRMRAARVELSQRFHDSTAQTANMISMGIHRAREIAGGSNSELAEALDAVYALSRHAIWEMRGPIDEGLIIDGRELGRSLWSHCATFQRITTISTEFHQSGLEPPLEMAVRSGLFSIAHNALTNALLHANPDKIEVLLEFDDFMIRLCVKDDGIGLPDDFADRGRGVRGMETVAQRVGGTLLVNSPEVGQGTTVTCLVPFHGSKGDT